MADEEMNHIKVLNFFIHDVRCCLPLTIVEKMLPLCLLETVPGSPIYLVGLMNLKRKCIPIIDLALSVGLGREELYALSTPIVLCSNQEHQVGLLVDKIIGIGDLDEKKIEIHEEFTRSQSPFYGAFTSEAGVSLIIDTDWLFSLKLGQETMPLSLNHE